MYKLEMTMLKMGDIILTCSDEKSSRVIRKYTKGSYSHAILYVGNSSYIHSDGEGVHSGNIQRLLFEEVKNVTVLRLTNSIRITKICEFARSQIGKSYSIKAAINAKIKSKFQLGSNRQFCSKLVAQAYAHVGINIVDDPEYCTPQQIEVSPLLNVVANCVYEASESEVDYAGSESPIERQTKATNQILKLSRKVTGKDIQTLDELSLYVINHHQFDSEISQIIKKSGYLSLWEHDKAKNPWRYDYSIFMGLSIPVEEKRDLAIREVKSSKEMTNRFGLILVEYEVAHRKHQLEYTEIHLQLYLQLCCNIRKMHETAVSVVNELT